MERREPGVVVAMPTLPDCITLKSWPWAPMKRVLVATSADEVVVPVIWALPWTERREPGVEVAIPVEPFEVTMNLVLDALLNLRKLPMKEPLADARLVVDAKSMRRPVPSKVPVAWVRVRREV